MLLYPIDTASTRLKGSKTKPLVSTFTFIKESFKKDGRGLYRGVALTFPHSFIPTALYIYIYENLLHYAYEAVDKWTNYKDIKFIFPFFMSGIAELSAMVFELPFDTVRTRLQMNLPEYQYSSAMVGLREIFEREGLLRFYKSTKVFLMTNIIYTASLFQFYEILNYKFGDRPYSVLLISPISAFTAAIIVNPLEVVLTRYALVDTTKKKLVLSYLLRRLWQREGLAGFYKGFVAESMIKSVNFLIWMPVFQYMRDQYGSALKD